ASPADHRVALSPLTQPSPPRGERAFLLPLPCLRERAGVRALSRLERHRRDIHAIPQSRRLRPVGEHMPEMPAAFRAMHLGPRHEQGAILRGADTTLDRRVKTRPAGAALELGRRVVDRRAATRTDEGAGSLFLVERAGPGALRAVLAQHMIRLWAELAAPLLVRFLDREVLGRR